MIVLYTTGCPKCNVLKKKLDNKGVVYTINNSVEDMTSMGITHVPVLRVGSELLGYMDAINWINNR